MLRDPLVLTFVFAFPIVTMLIIGGAFGTTPDRAFDWHQSGALVRRVVSHRGDRRGRPGHAAGAPGVLPGARACCAGSPRPASRAGRSRSPSSSSGWCRSRWPAALLLAVAAPVYGIPPVHTAWRVAAALLLGRGGLREHRRAARLAAAVGPVRPGRGAAAVLPLVPARRGRPAAARDGLRGAGRRGPAAADPGDQRRPRAVAGLGHGHRVAAALAAWPWRPPRWPPAEPRCDQAAAAVPAGLSDWPAARAGVPSGHGRQRGRVPARRLSPGWARWAGPRRVRRARRGRARSRCSPDLAGALAAAAAAAWPPACCSSGSGRPLLVYAAVATAGVAVLGHGTSTTSAGSPSACSAAGARSSGAAATAWRYWAGALCSVRGRMGCGSPDPGWARMDRRLDALVILGAADPPRRSTWSRSCGSPRPDWPSGPARRSATASPASCTTSSRTP